MQFVTNTSINPHLALLNYGEHSLVNLAAHNNYTCDLLPEWGARVCYKSTNKFGSVPEFMTGIIKSEHYDVLEHGSISIMLNGEKNYNFYKYLFDLKQWHPYLNIEILKGNQTETTVILSATPRVWRDIVIMGGELPETEITQSVAYISFLINDLFYKDIAVLLYGLKLRMPHTLYDLDVFSIEQDEDFISISQRARQTFSPNIIKSVAPVTTDTGAVVTLLGYAPPVYSYDSFPDNYQTRNGRIIDSTFHVTFQIENVSRAFTHQHVRHRLLSHCLAPETLVHSIGQKKWTIEELYKWKDDVKLKGRLKLIKLRGVNENGVLVPVTIKDIIYSGKQKVYKLTTKSGRKIRATENHRFLTLTGWKRLADINVGEYVFSNGLLAYQDVDKHHKAWHGAGTKLVFRDEIISIIEDEIVDTYDIEINEDLHNFVANGIVVHNSQESQRYVDVNKSGKSIVYPTDLTEDQRLYLEYAVDGSFAAYDDLRAKGMKKEDARMVLPNCITTKIVTSGYINAWTHYIKLRAAKDAQYEIRQVAEAIDFMLKQIKESEVSE